MSTIRTIFAFPRWLMKHPVLWVLFWPIATPLVFLIDGHLTLAEQLLPALFMCWMLIGGLSIRSKHDQLLLSVLVVVAAVAETTASLVLHWYAYRLHNIPLWIPPGHGVVFLTAMVSMELNWVRKHATLLRKIVTAGVITYGAFGLFRTPADVAGAAIGGVFLIWLWGTGEAKGRFYTMLWPWVCFVEIVGVQIGAWRWASNMPTTGFSEASPPSGIVGAYGFMDLAAFGVVALFIRLAQRRSAKRLVYSPALADSATS